MTGFFAEGDLTPNRIELARRQALAGAGYVDLTSSNPTRQGLLFPPDVLREAAAAYWPGRRYEPDPRGLLAAREAISRYYAARTPALDVPVEQIFITASTSEAYGLLFGLLAEPGDNVLGPEVTSRSSSTWRSCTTSSCAPTRSTRRGAGASTAPTSRPPPTSAAGPSC